MIRVLAAVILALLLTVIWQRGTVSMYARKADASEAARAAAEASLIAANELIKAERAKADRMADIADRYEKDKTDAQATADRVVADLRADNLRLQKRWAGCPAMPATATASGELDAAAADRGESASRIVRAAAECDSQVRGLQAVIAADRE